MHGRKETYWINRKELQWKQAVQVPHDTLLLQMTNGTMFRDTVIEGHHTQPKILTFSDDLSQAHKILVFIKNGAEMLSDSYLPGLYILTGNIKVLLIN